jgi:structural maintenance of chromosome 1
MFHFCFIVPLQLTRTIESREENIEKLKADIRKIEDQIFGPFSRQVGVDNILEYEERRVRLAKEATEKRLLFTTQRSRITSLCVQKQKLMFLF